VKPIAVLLILSFESLALAGETPSEIDAMRRRIAQDRVRVTFLEKEEASILRGLEDLERGIAEKKRTVAALGDMVREVEARIAEIDRRLLENDAEIAALRRKAAGRASALHRLQRTSLASIVARAGRGSIDTRRLRDRLRFVLSYDGNLMRSVRDATSRDRTLRAELTERKRSVDESKAALAEETEAALLLEEQRRVLLEAVRGEKKTYQRLAKELRAALDLLEKELGTVRGAAPAPEAAEGGFAEQKGRLPWPVEGRVEMTFGRKVDPESGMVMTSKGVDIRAKASAPIRSVFGGRVAFADRFEGFGQMMIVDHGGGFYTIYAHLESFAARKGHAVNAHQVIGYVGDSGSTKGSYLYFEIRQGPQPVDPLLWLTR
jgi:septal ring factor EnvC (AmiA/AmiB activator)